ANLANLGLSAGTLAPAFDSLITSYSATVPASTSSLTVTPAVEDNTATVKVNDVAVTSGSPSTSIGLVVGHNIITLKVTAQDNTLKTYSVDVLRNSARIAVEQPAGAALTDGASTVDFGSVIKGRQAAKQFTIKNNGDVDLVLGTFTKDGTDAA